MSKLSTLISLTAVCVVMAAAGAWADVPQNMNVQGRLTDGTGTPVPSGFKLFTFKIFDDEFAGVEIWPGGAGETQTIFTDDNGLWNARVGAVIALSESVFFPDTNRWLQITVDDGVNPPETLPRIKLNTDPYSYRSALSQQADTASYAWLAEDANLLSGHHYSDFAQAIHGHTPADISPQGAGSGMDADLLDGQSSAYYRNASNVNSGILQTGFYSAYSDLISEGYLDNNHSDDLLMRSQADKRYVEIAGDVMTGYLGTPGVSCGHATLTGLFNLYMNGSANPVIIGGEWSGHGARWDLYDESNNAVIVCEANTVGTGGYFEVAGNEARTYFLAVDGNDGGGNPLMMMVGSGSGTLLRTDISGDLSVMLPSSAISAVEVLDEPGIVSNRDAGGTALATASMTDILTVTIDTPEDGYIVVEGKCYAALSGTTLQNQAVVQIDEFSGGTWTMPYYSISGLDTYGSTGANRFSMYVQRVYEKPAGSYTFRMEGQKMGSTGTADIYYPIVTATYYSTSYGSVTTFASATEAAQFEQAEAVTVQPDPLDATVTTETLYRVDLRELELKAARARKAADAAELELIKARRQQQIAQSAAAEER